MGVKVYKGYKGVVGMDGVIAAWYAQITQKGMPEYTADAQRVAARVPQGSAVLDLAAGPGYLAIELAKLGSYKITGLDISRTCVDIARAKSRRARVAVNFRHGNAADMPFGSEIFDFIICKSAFKNFAEPIDALDEMHRVLKVGGTALITDLRGDVSQEVVDHYVDHMGLDAVNTLITKWTFRYSLLRRAYTRDQFRSLVTKSRFKMCEIKETKIGLEVWLKR